MTQQCVSYLNDMLNHHMRIIFFTVGTDYLINGGGFEFQPSSNPTFCFNGVMIEEDALLEETEMFFLFLSSSDPDITLDTSFSQLTILILDSDSKLT